MEIYSFPENLCPTYLYRVQQYGSATMYSQSDGFAAQDQTTTFGRGEEKKFRKAVENHLSWGCREPSPFISLFKDKARAKEHWFRRVKHAPLFTIEASKIPPRRLFEVKDLEVLIAGGQFDAPEMARVDIERGEWLCLHSIPFQALVKEENYAGVENIFEHVNMTPVGIKDANLENEVLRVLARAARELIILSEVIRDILEVMNSAQSSSGISSTASPLTSDPQIQDLSDALDELSVQAE